MSTGKALFNWPELQPDCVILAKYNPHHKFSRWMAKASAAVGTQSVPPWVELSTFPPTRALISQPYILHHLHAPFPIKFLCSSNPLEYLTLLDAYKETDKVCLSCRPVQYAHTHTYLSRCVSRNVSFSSAFDLQMVLVEGDSISDTPTHV